MNVILNDKALYLIFPADAANIDASISNLDKMLKDMVTNNTITETWRPIFDGYIKLCRRRQDAAQKNTILQSTATKED